VTSNLIIWGLYPGSAVPILPFYQYGWTGGCQAGFKKRVLHELVSGRSMDYRGTSPTRTRPAP
jgi:hypothetical protein